MPLSRNDREEYVVRHASCGESIRALAQMLLELPDPALATRLHIGIAAELSDVLATAVDLAAEAMNEDRDRVHRSLTRPA